MKIELSLTEVNTLLNAYCQSVDTSRYDRSDPHPDAQAVFSLLDKLELAQQKMMLDREKELADFTSDFAKLLAEELD